MEWFSKARSCAQTDSCMYMHAFKVAAALRRHHFPINIFCLCLVIRFADSFLAEAGGEGGKD